MFRFGRPVPGGVKAQVSQGWWALRDGGTRRHRAIDISLKVGTPVLAMEDGAVVRADPVGEPMPGTHGDPGKWIAITHANGVASHSLHLSRVDVAAGQKVRKGQQIGLSGNTGSSSGPHLHITLLVQKPLLADVTRWVGAPTTGWTTPRELNPHMGWWRIPCEPWVPVDGYKPEVAAAAKKYGIPLHRGGGLSPLVIGVGLGLVAVALFS